MSIKSLGANCLALLFSFLPIKNNKVFISSFHGNYYNDSPKIISDELAKNKSLDIVWALQADTLVPDGIRTVKPFSIRELYEIETAKVWIDNSRKELWIKKRKNQYYIQTWHGSVGFKKAEADAEDTLDKKYVLRAKHDSKMIDLLVSDNDWQYSMFKRGHFWYDGEIIKCAIRQPMKSDESCSLIRREIREKYGVSIEARMVLYAPTFRENGNTGPYNIDYKLLMQSLKKKFGGDWFVIVRLHPNLKEYQKSLSFDSTILDGHIISDLDDLAIASDIIISDYSSALFYGMRLRKTAFVYAEDWKEYERGFYFSLKDLPCPFADNNELLKKQIEMFDHDKYLCELEPFLKELGFCDAPGPELIREIVEKQIG